MKIDSTADMRLALTIILILLTPSLAKAESDSSSSSDIASVVRSSASIDSMLTRYGSSHQTFYQLNLKPEFSLKYKSFRASVIAPLGAGVTVNSSCCRFSFGNLSLQVEQQRTAKNLSWWTNASISLPTSGLSDSRGHTNGVAATVAITDDAGYFLPDTTTLRANVGGEYPLASTLLLGAEAGAHRWIRGNMHPDQTLIPLTIYGQLAHSKSLRSKLAFKSIANLDAVDEHWLHQAAINLSYEWNGNTLGGSIEMPLDASLRQLDMVRAGVSYARNY